jgi:hypothetical protein
VHLYVHAVVVAAPPGVRSGGLLTEGVYAAGVPGVEDFGRYVDERGIAEEAYPAAFALWIAEVTGGPVPRFEKVEREEPADGLVIEGDDL